jgi:hypothetical protein
VPHSGLEVPDGNFEYELSLVWVVCRLPSARAGNVTDDQTPRASARSFGMTSGVRQVLRDDERLRLGASALRGDERLRQVLRDDERR